MSPLIDDIDAIVKTKMPDGWLPYKWECVAGGYLVTGSIPNGVYQSGPRKGAPRHSGNGEVVVVSDGDLKAAATAYEASTGKCWRCKGSGQIDCGWSKAEGTTYRRCEQCGGTGKAQEAS
jgi:hypothetical protein